MSHIGSLAILIGEEVSSVSFVRDYFELNADGPVLRIFGDVSIVQKEYRVKADQEQFANMFRRIIGSKIEGFDERGGVLNIVLSNDIAILVPLARLEYMHFVPNYGAPVEVWSGLGD